MTTSAHNISLPSPTNWGLAHEIATLREMIAAAEATGIPRLPGNAQFLPDGRILCGPRTRGDSRYPYGNDGLHFWVHASGRMYGNRGQYYIFLPFHDGHEPRVAFFLGRQTQDGRYAAVPLLPTPRSAVAEAATRQRFAVFGHDAAYFGMQTSELFGALRVYVDQSQDRHIDIVFSTLIYNESAAPLSLYTSAFINPFCRHQFAETSEDRWFKRIDALAASNDHNRIGPFRIAVNEDIDRYHSTTNFACVRRVADADITAHEVCTSRIAYLGTPETSLADAACLTSGTFGRDVPTTVFNDNAIAGDLLRFSLEPGESAQFHHVLSLLPTDHDPAELMNTRLTSTHVDTRLTDIRRSQSSESHQLAAHFEESGLPGISDHAFNSFIPFLTKQVDVCAQTRGYMQPSPNSLIGIRDVFQALEGQIYDQPDRARAKILEAIDFVLTDGRCPRQYSMPVKGANGRADLREFIDQGAWVISAIHSYVMLTGDKGLLDETAGYHRIVPGTSQRIEPADERDTVLDHLFRILTYLDRQRDPATRLLRILYGDWNDAVDGLGTSLEPGSEYGSGVSVMASLQLYRNCTEIVELMDMLPGQQHNARREDCLEMRDELREGLVRHAVVPRDAERRIVHGWGDRRRYFIGSFADSDGLSRDSLTSNAFWVLSGMIAETPDLRHSILAAIDRLDARYGLATFAPGFAPDAPGVGRVRRLPLGTAENGATYIHASLFGVWALFEMGEPQRAWEQLHKLLPFSPHHTNLSHSPFVMPNSYIDNESLGLTGQSMNDWQTGSSNVLLKVLVRCVCGLRPRPDVLEIGPASHSPFRSFEFRAVVRGHPLTIRLQHANTATRSYRLNHELVPASTDDQRGIRVLQLPYDQLLAGHNLVEITDPA